MNSSELSLQVKELLIECVESVSELEVLLFFLRFPKERWSIEDIQVKLRSNQNMSERSLKRLHHFGFLTFENSTYKYNETNNRHQTVTELAELYSTRPVTIIAFMYNKPNDQLMGFADAFKLKKD